MDPSQNSGSESSSFTQSFIDGPFYHYSRATVLSKSWTDENPGRRVYKCDIHGFFNWTDKEKQNGWQKVSLLEARDYIRRLKEEIKELRAVNQQRINKGDESSGSSIDSAMVKLDSWKKHEEEKKKLEYEAMASKDREKLLRQFIVLSWGGFIVVTAMIFKMVKN